MYIPSLPISLLLLTLPFTISTPLTPRDATTVQTDLSSIATDLSTLTSAVNSYTGGLTAALSIQRKEEAVEHDIDTAIADTHAATAFTTSESSAVAAAWAGLQPDIDSSLGALVSKVLLRFFIFSHWCIRLDGLMGVEIALRVRRRRRHRAARSEQSEDEDGWAVDCVAGQGYGGGQGDDCVEDGGV